MKSIALKNIKSTQSRILVDLIDKTIFAEFHINGMDYLLDSESVNKEKWSHELYVNEQEIDTSKIDLTELEEFLIEYYKNEKNNAYTPEETPIY